MDAAASTPAIVTGLLDFILALPCERFIHLFTRREGASSHCQMGGMSYARVVIFQWLNHTLCGKAPLGNADVADREAFVNLFKKFGGEMGAEKAQKLLDVATLI